MIIFLSRYSPRASEALEGAGNLLAVQLSRADPASNAHGHDAEHGDDDEEAVGKHDLEGQLQEEQELPDGANGHHEPDDEAANHGSEIVRQALVDCQLHDIALVHTHRSEHAQLPLRVPNVGLNGQHKLEEAKDVADERDDGVEDVQDDHPVRDVFGEIEAVEQEHLFIVDVVQQII